ncbi:MAG: Ig-like domain-containing protein [Phycisphaerales bacterium]
MKSKVILFSAVAILVAIALVVLIRGMANNPPTAEAGSVTVLEDTPKSIPIVGGDRDGDPLTYSVITGPSHGRLSGTAPNLTYSPNKDFNGRDSFTFKVSDGKADSAAATLSIMVTPVNDPPMANDDSVTAQEDAPIVTIDVLINDTDLDNSRLMVVTTTQGGNGSVTINTDSTLTYAPNRNFCGTDTFTYTLSDGRGGTDTATVNVTVKAVNDVPSITSKPVETTRVWASYSYDVDAKDPDLGDSLVYSLAKKPEGMTIDQATGLIEWRPTSAQAGTHDVTVSVADDYRIRASDTQSFTVTATSLSSPLKTVLTVADGFSQKGRGTLSAKDKITVVQTSDNNRWEIEPGLYACYDFCDASVPAGASIISVVVYVEHFEEHRFPHGKSQWSVGMGWPARPAVWASTDAPVRQGQSNEATDSWDVTSSVETAEKANSLQLQVKNDDTTGRRKTAVDYIYAVVEWY